ncbi:MAG: FHA domain-containing protein [Eubacterium sp.]|nr:FHA domain-containing protein [Eubacterium sp.]
MDKKSSIFNEYFAVLMSCSSAPISGNAESNAKYLIKKILYFRENGIPNEMLYELASKIVVFCTEYYESNFEDFLAVMGNSLIPAAMALEEIGMNNPEQIVRISAPIIAYIKKIANTENWDKCVCTGNTFEIIMCSIENVENNVIKIIANDWGVFFVKYFKIMLDIKYASKSVEYFNDAVSFAEYAEVLFRESAPILYYIALCYDIAGKQEKANLAYHNALEKAFDENILAAIYISLSIQCAESGNEDLCHCLLDIAMEYSDKPVAYPCISADMMKKLLFPFHKNNFNYFDKLKFLKDNGITIGYSKLVKSASMCLQISGTNSNLQTLAEKILSDKHSIDAEYALFPQYDIVLLESPTSCGYIFNVNREYIIGRENKICDIVVGNDLCTSRKQCTVLTYKERLVLQNYSSMHTTYINNVQVKDLIELNNGILKMGRTLFGIKVFYKSPFIENDAESHKDNNTPGSYEISYDRTLKKYCKTILLEKTRYFFLSMFYSQNGTFENYSFDIEAANDSHYEFGLQGEEKLKHFLSADTNISLSKVLIKAFDDIGNDNSAKAKLLLFIKDISSMQFHY